MLADFCTEIGQSSGMFRLQDMLCLVLINSGKDLQIAAPSEETHIVLLCQSCHNSAGGYCSGA